VVPKDPDLLAEQPETTPEVRADRSTSFWIVAFAFLIVMAFATLPSPLYGIYKVRDDLSSLTITIVYAVFAAGTIAVLLAENRIAGRIGRRGAMLGSVLVMMLAAGILAVWHGLPVLVVGRLLTGVAAGLAAGTAITYLIELRLRAQPGSSIVWPRTVGTSISVGALGVGPLIAGCLAQWARWPLTLPYLVMLGLGVIALIGLWFVPETGTLMKRVPPTDKPKKRSARLPVPAAAGTLAAFSANGLFAGLAGLILAITLGRTSHALAGATLFLVFSCGVLSQVATPKLAAPRVLALGTILMLIGLAFLVVSVRLSTPSLALFLISGALIGGGVGAVFKGTTGIVLATAAPEDRLILTSRLLVVLYVGLSIPVVGAGIALDQGASIPNTVLGFAILVALGVSASGWVLLGRHRTSNASLSPEPEGSPPN
jgi:predicted MFS family arabinose efflux permease